MKLDNVTRGRGFASGAFGPLAISIWDAPPRIEDARVAADLLATLARREPRMLVMAVLGPDTPPPESAVRDTLAKKLAEIGDKVRCVANVVEGQGFRAATMRAVLTGMVLVIRPKYPQMACATIMEGSHFVAEQSELRLDPLTLANAVRELRTPPT
jgi:hypothetical protein